MVFLKKAGKHFSMVALGLSIAVANAQSDSPPTVKSTIIGVSRATDVRQVDSLKSTLSNLHAAHPVEIDQSFADLGINVHQLLASKASGQVWSSSAVQEQVDRVITRNSPPQPISSGQLLPAVSPTQFPVFSPLSPADQALLLRLASSVGRFEVVDSSGTKTTQGTAFVVGTNTIATNCHVISDENNNQLTDVGAFLVDFSNSPAHSSSNEFRITKIFPCPGRQGFDVALLSVAPTSVDGTRQLPPSLSLVKQQPPFALPTQKNIWLVGYPNLSEADEPLYQVLEASAPGQYSEIYTPGLVQQVASVNAPNGSPHFDVILHIGSSDSGNSGSPVFNTQGQVIGVDHCCFNSIVSIPSSPIGLPCGWVYGQPHYNESIASWEVWNDPVLGPILSAAQGSGNASTLPDVQQGLKKSSEIALVTPKIDRLESR